MKRLKRLRSAEDTHWASRCTWVSAGCHRRCPRARGHRNGGPPLRPGSGPRPAPRFYCCPSSSSETGGEEGRKSVYIIPLLIHWECVCVWPDLDKGDLARAHVALGVLDDHLAIVLQPALRTQHIVDAGHHLVPFIVIPGADMTAVQ